METAEIIRVISARHEWPIRKLNGKTTIFQARHVFKWIDSDFKKFGLDKSSQPTKKMNVIAGEVTGRTFLQIFMDINPDLGKSVLTISQIIALFEGHPSWLLQEGLRIFFLIKKNLGIFRKILALFSKGTSEHYYVFVVNVYLNGLCARVYLLDDDVRSGEHHYVVYPQFIPLAG